jgi:AAA domain
MPSAGSCCGSKAATAASGFLVEVTDIAFDEPFDPTTFVFAPPPGEWVRAGEDSGQLSSVQAGEWLASLIRRLDSHELREVVRQRHPRERHLLAQVRRGDPADYIADKTNRGHLHVHTGDSNSALAVGRELAGIGAIPAARANLASVAKRSAPAISPTSLAAVSGPQPRSATG